MNAGHGNCSGPTSKEKFDAGNSGERKQTRFGSEKEKRQLSHVYGCRIRAHGALSKLRHAFSFPLLACEQTNAR